MKGTSAIGSKLTKISLNQYEEIQSIFVLDCCCKVSLILAGGLLHEV